MKASLCFFLLTLAGITFCPGADPAVLVNTRFDFVDSKGGLKQMSPREITEATLPVRMPTSVRVRPPSRVQAGTTAMGELQPPFAVIDTQALPGKPEQAGNAEIEWDLRSLLLKSGRYALSCDVLPLEGNVGGLSVRFTAAMEDGSTIWPQKPPFLVSIGKDSVGLTEAGETSPPAANAPLAVRIEIDLDTETWTASLNGTPLNEETPFDLFTPEGGLMLGAALIRPISAPGTRMAVSNVKVERLPSTASPSEKRVAADKLPRIACVGDSITQGFGFGNPQVEAYPGVLRKLLKGRARVGNFGVSGTTLLKNGDSPYWRQSAFDRAKAFAPNLVVIMLGTNDSKPPNWAKSDQLSADAAALVKEFRDLPTQPQVIVVLPVPVFKTAFGITEEFTAQVRPLVEKGAIEAGATVVNPGATFEGHAKWFGDGVHPNQQGAAALAQFISEQLPLPKQN